MLGSLDFTVLGLPFNMEPLRSEPGGNLLGPLEEAL